MFDFYTNEKNMPSRLFEEYSILHYNFKLDDNVHESFSKYMESVGKENYYFKKNLLAEYIEKKISDPKVQQSVIEFTGKFMDDHSFQLSTPGPTYSFTFGDTETSFLYSTFDLTKEKLLALSKEMITETYDGTSEFHTIKAAPHKLIILGMLITALQKGYEDIVTCCEYLFGFAEYPMLFKVYWKMGVDKAVMDYTIEHLSNKFKIKKMKNVQELLKYDVNSSINKFKDKLIIASDTAWMDTLNRIRTQLNSTLRKLANEYYINIENNASQHDQATTHDDGKLVDSEGFMTNAAKIIENICNKFDTTTVNAKLAKVSAEGRQVDGPTLISFLNQIMSSTPNRVNKFIELVIQSYMTRNKSAQEINSKEFLNYGISLYRSIGISKDPLYSEIKEILQYWMKDIINIEQYYTRAATIINYTRAVFDYMIFMINYYS